MILQKAFGSLILSLFLSTISLANTTELKCATKYPRKTGVRITLTKTFEGDDVTVNYKLVEFEVLPDHTFVVIEEINNSIVVTKSKAKKNIRLGKRFSIKNEIGSVTESFINFGGGYRKRNIVINGKGVNELQFTGVHFPVDMMGVGTDEDIRYDFSINGDDIFLYDLVSCWYSDTTK